LHTSTTGRTVTPTRHATTAPRGATRPITFGVYERVRWGQANRGPASRLTPAGHGHTPPPSMERRCEPAPEEPWRVRTATISAGCCSSVHAFRRVRAQLGAPPTTTSTSVRPASTAGSAVDLAPVLDVLDRNGSRPSAAHHGRRSAVAGLMLHSIQWASLDASSCGTRQGHGTAAGRGQPRWPQARASSTRHHQRRERAGRRRAAESTEPKSCAS